LNKIEDTPIKKRICHFCKKDQIIEDGYPIDIWFENNRNKKPWNHMPLNSIAHADCYIENIVLEELKNFEIQHGLQND